MSSFKDKAQADIKRVFCNPEHFAEHRVVVYEGVIYDGAEGEGIPIVLTQVKQLDRERLTIQDHAEGLYTAKATLYAAAADLDNVIPEKGTRIKVSDSDDTEFFRTYSIITSECTIGMLTLELEVMDE
jgi:hypothetical protein